MAAREDKNAHNALLERNTHVRGVSYEVVRMLQRYGLLGDRLSEAQLALLSRINDDAIENVKTINAARPTELDRGLVRTLRKSADHLGN